MIETLSRSAVAPEVMVPMLMLVLDDSRFDRARLRQFCEGSRIPVIVREADSIEALQRMISEETFDIFVLDYRLPVGSGLVASRLLRATPDTRHAGIVMISGRDEPGIASRARRDGCDLFLGKGALNADILHDILLDLKMSRAERIIGIAEKHRTPNTPVC